MRNKILIVDDEEVNRELLKQMFEKDYEILEASNGKDAIVMVGKYMDEIAIILLDIMMPVLNGYQVLQVLNAKKIINKIPVILITASDDEKAELQCYSLGATAVITKPFATKVVIKRVLSTIEMYKNIESLELTVESQNKEILQQRKMLELYNEHLLDAISNIVEFRNLESGMHVKRIKGFTKILAKAVEDAVVSPISEAFRIVRDERHDINLYHTDKHHQSVYGSYLKSCVNYLVLYGKPFGSSPADCNLDPQVTAYLRSVAERVVLK